MFPPGLYGVGVGIAELDPLPVEEDFPVDPRPYPSRLGELLPVRE